VNGNDVGVKWRWRSHFASELLERNGRQGRRDPEIRRVPAWEIEARQGGTQSALRRTRSRATHCTDRTPSSCAHPGSEADDAPVPRSALACCGLRGGQLPASRAFDARFWGATSQSGKAWEAWHAAVCEHALLPEPLTLRLEPIGFMRTSARRSVSAPRSSRRASWPTKMLDDPGQCGLSSSVRLQEISRRSDSGKLIGRNCDGSRRPHCGVACRYIFPGRHGFRLFARRVRSLPVAPSEAPAPRPTRYTSSSNSCGMAHARTSRSPTRCPSP